MKYSIIVPIWDPSVLMWELITECIESIGRHSEEEDYELIKIINVSGFPVAVNRGLERARGDFLVVLNDDVIVKDKEWLKKLGQPNCITSWRLHPFFITGRPVPDGACWCMPRNIYEKLGKLDEQFGAGYGFDDSDYWMRAEEANIPFKDAGVNLTHGGSKTFQTYYPEEKEAMTKKNHELFLAKWKNKLGSR